MSKRKAKIRILLIIFSNFWGLLTMLLIHFVFQIAIQRNINTYLENQSLLASSFLMNAATQANNNNSDITDYLIVNIKKDFPTSSSVYCVITKNNNIAFYKDENTTSTLLDENIDNYLQDNISLKDHKKYLLSKSEVQYNDDTYALIICTRATYYIKKIKLDEIRLYCLGFFFIYGVLLNVLLIYYLYKLNTADKVNATLLNDMKRNRQLIDLLENDRNRHYVNSEKEFSFYSRSIVEEVISNMTLNEINNCIQIDIIIENPNMDHFILITAILSRIKGNNSIACYWEKNQFKILLFNANKMEAQEFMNLFISKYKSESEEKVEELKVIASRLNTMQNVVYASV